MLFAVSTVISSLMSCELYTDDGGSVLCICLVIFNVGRLILIL